MSRHPKTVKNINEPDRLMVGCVQGVLGIGAHGEVPVNNLVDIFVDALGNDAIVGFEEVLWSEPIALFRVRFSNRSFL